MPKFGANLTIVFNEVDFLDRFAAAGKAGFKGVEYLFPYDYDKNRLAEKLHEARPDAGAAQPARRQLGRGRARHRLPPGPRRRNSRTASAKAIEYATALGCKQINCLAGIRPRDVDPTTRARRSSSNLRFAAPRLKDAGIKLLIEAINTRDIPGFFLNHTQQALRHHRRRSAPTICSSSTTSITCRSWRATSRRPSRSNLARSPTCSSPTTPAATSRAPARSTTVPVPAHRQDRLPGLDRLRIQARRRIPRPGSAGSSLIGNGSRHGPTARPELEFQYHRFGLHLAAICPRRRTRIILRRST